MAKPRVAAVPQPIMGAYYKHERRVQMAEVVRVISDDRFVFQDVVSEIKFPVSGEEFRLYWRLVIYEPELDDLGA